MRPFSFAFALLVGACSGADPEGRGGLSGSEADELNQAAATLDEQQALTDGDAR